MIIDGLGQDVVMGKPPPEPYKRILPAGSLIKGVVVEGKRMGIAAIVDASGVPVPIGSQGQVVRGAGATLMKNLLWWSPVAIAGVATLYGIKKKNKALYIGGPVAGAAWVYYLLSQLG